MTEIQLGSGSSSSNTHRSTQPSHTLNRRYVERPSNLAIEEAAHSVHTHTTDTSTARPSRLVNLRVHASDLMQLQAQNPQPESPSSIQSTSAISKVIELGHDCQNENIHDEKLNGQYAIAATSSFSTTSDMAPVVTNTTEPSPKDLAMSIATDYAAANLNVVESNNSNSSIDAIAQATSEAIAAIRNATEPEEIAEQVLSLKLFAEDIKNNSSAPEILELSTTIEKFVDVAMKSSRVNEEVQRRLAEKEAAAQAEKAKKSEAVAIQSAKPAPKKIAAPTSSKAKVATAPHVAGSSSMDATLRRALRRA